MGFASVVDRLGPHSIFGTRHRSEPVSEPIVWIQIKRLLQLVNGYLFAFKFSEPVLRHVQYLPFVCSFNSRKHHEVLTIGCDIIQVVVTPNL